MPAELAELVSETERLNYLCFVAIAENPASYFFNSSGGDAVFNTSVFIAFFSLIRMLAGGIN